MPSSTTIAVSPAELVAGNRNHDHIQRPGHRERDRHPASRRPSTTASVPVDQLNPVGHGLSGVRSRAVAVPVVPNGGPAAWDALRHGWRYLIPGRFRPPAAESATGRDQPMIRS
jgi:hypothetical protein